LLIDISHERRVMGLMAPFGTNPERLIPSFSSIRRKAAQIKLGHTSATSQGAPQTNTSNRSAPETYRVLLKWLYLLYEGAEYGDSSVATPEL
jgi:hypothetical protein